MFNRGHHYDNYTGIYTVAVDGLYEISVFIKGHNDTGVGIRIVVDGTLVSGWGCPSKFVQCETNTVWLPQRVHLLLQVTNNYVMNHDYPYPELSAVVLLPLTRGQQVWVRPNGIGSLYGADKGGMLSWFSAHLVYAF